jgi:hypothetical protein
MNPSAPDRGRSPRFPTLVSRHPSGHPCESILSGIGSLAPQAAHHRRCEMSTTPHCVMRAVTSHALIARLAPVLYRRRLHQAASLPYLHALPRTCTQSPATILYCPRVVVLTCKFCRAAAAPQSAGCSCTAAAACRCSAAARAAFGFCHVEAALKLWCQCPRPSHRMPFSPHPLCPFLDTWP